MEGEGGDDIDMGEGRSAIHAVTQSIVDDIKVLSRLTSGNPPGEDGEDVLEEETGDTEDALRRVFEEQEITLRQALHVIS